jgi:hypothetical protein
MTIIAILLIYLLWLTSIFSFAKWRVLTFSKGGNDFSVLTDSLFQIYLKLSGMAVLIWMCMMIELS